MLHFSMALMSSSFENRAHVLTSLPEILSRSWKSTSQACAELKELCRVSHKLSNLIQGRQLNRMDLIAKSLHFLTQFISFHRPYFLLVISSILLSKKTYFIFLTVFLNFFQSSKLWDCWYLLISLRQSLFHHALKYLVMLTSLEYLSQVLSILMASI